MTPAAANIVLIGLRGAGKSTIGRVLAGKLNREFVDLDHRTAELLNSATAGEAFASHGESVFRIAEHRAVISVLAEPSRVVALGGGTPTAPGAAALLEEEREAGRALIVYLRGEPDTLRSRLRSTDVSSRPSLTGAGTLDEIEAVMRARDPLYRRLATVVIDIETGSADGLAERIAAIAAAHETRK